MTPRSTLSLLWFGIGIVLTMATQLRGPGGIGPGEILLAGWVALSVATWPLRRDITVTPIFTATLLFWAIGALALVSGFLIAPAGGDGSGAAHDAGAFAFVAVLLLAFLAGPDVTSRFRRSLRVVLICSILPLFGLWLVALVTPHLGPLELWYYDRFVGWSTNPNQVALAMAPAPMLCAFAGRDRGDILRWGWRLLGGIAIWVGVVSGSDALRVAWAGAATWLAAAWWRRVCVRGRRHPPSAILGFGLAPALLAVVALSVGHDIATRTGTVLGSVYEKGDQGADRLMAWQGGVRVLAASPVVGRGPGAHAAGYLTSEVLEAHNTFIDWGASTGTIGLAAYVGLLCWVLLVLWRAGEPLLLSAVIALLTFSLFGYVLRQPIYWFYLLAAVGLATPIPLARSRG